MPSHPKGNSTFSLSSPRLILRLARPSDVLSLLKFHRQNQEHLASWEPPLRPEDFFTLDYWKKAIDQAEKGYSQGQSLRLLLCAKGNEQIIGMANFSNFERGFFQNCRLGYKLAASAEGQGYMQEALNAAINYLFHTRKFHRIEANCLPHNQRSRKLLQRLGFNEHGIAPDYLLIAGKWQDHLLCSKTNLDWMPKPH